MAKNVTLTSSKVLELPRRLQSTYMLWTQGVDLQSLLPKTTFYSHRSALLAFDIDINLPCDTPNMTNVVPLLRVLEAQSVSVPNWAYEQGLVYDKNSFKSIGLRVA